jgi:hypothetical protein
MVCGVCAWHQLDIRTDSSEMQESLTALGSFYTHKVQCRCSALLAAHKSHKQMCFVCCARGASCHCAAELPARSCGNVLLNGLCGSSFVPQNTTESRRQLRSDLEAEGLRIARDFISDFSEIEKVRRCWAGS